MTTITLTSNESKKAREALNLSQAKTSKESGINRSYLSQFENGQRILDDKTLEQLYAYYIQEGWGEEGIEVVEEEQAIKEGIIKVRDGFVIPAETNDETIENLLAEYEANSDEIGSSVNTEVSRGFFGGINRESTLADCQRPLFLMARNFCIIKQLHGHETLLPNPKDESEIKTQKEFIELQFAHL